MKRREKAQHPVLTKVTHVEKRTKSSHHLDFLIEKEEDESTTFSFKNAANLLKHTEKMKTSQDHLHISQCSCSQLLLLLCLMPQKIISFQFNDILYKCC